jgi:hypothetical protein
MTTVSRLTIAATIFTLAAVACTAAPDESTSVEVNTDQVTPACIKGGTTCAPLGGTRGTVTGGLITSFSGNTLADPATPPPSPPALPGKGEAPIDCGNMGCRWDSEHFGCDCSGVGYGVESSIHCGFTNPCPRLVLGAYRCYPGIYCGL